MFTEISLDLLNVTNKNQTLILNSGSKEALKKETNETSLEKNAIWQNKKSD